MVIPLNKFSESMHPFWLHPIWIKKQKKLTEMIIKGEHVQRYETLRLRKEGMTINVSITLSPVFDSYGKLIAISFIFQRYK